MTLDGLTKRGGVWTYRKVIPPKLRAAMGAREIWRSLDTGNETVALIRYAKVKSQVDQMLLVHLTSMLESASERPEGETYGRGGLTPEQIQALLASQPDDADNPPLSVIFARYYAERRLPAKTQLEWDGVLRRIQAVMGGDCAIRSVTQAHVRGLKDSLLATQSNRGERTLSPATVQKNLSGLRAVLGWAKSNGYISVNPAEGMMVVSKMSGDEGRLPYSPEDLRRIFTVERFGPANYWLPYLALYTGARLEELGQLTTADIDEESEAPFVQYIWIRPGDGKRVKTKSSIRRVPIHPMLSGFVDFAVRQDGPLFPELTRTSYGSLTAAWSKWWGRHARKVCGISDPRKTFHSFRHGWKDAARGVMPEEHHDAITGHSNGSVGRSYGTGVPLKVLAESMAKVTFKI
jgi:integrase